MCEKKRWMEVIRVRSDTMGATTMLSQMGDLMQALGGSVEGLVGTFVMAGNEYEGDVALMFNWLTSWPPAKSRTGCMLAESFSRYGVVGHSIWDVSDYFWRGEKHD